MDLCWNIVFGKLENLWSDDNVNVVYEIIFKGVVVDFFFYIEIDMYNVFE